MIRWFVAYLALLIFLVWLTGGFQRTSPGMLVAARNLPTGHLLQANDFALVPGSSGTYLRRPIDAGQPIRAGDTTASPDFTTRMNFVPLAFPIARSLVASGELNAGVKTRICQTGKTVLDDAEVRVVACPADEQTCLSIVDILVEKASAVATALKNPGVPSLRQSSKSCE
jgi:hypothetical protein